MCNSVRSFIPVHVHITVDVNVMFKISQSLLKRPNIKSANLIVLACISPTVICVCNEVASSNLKIEKFKA